MADRSPPGTPATTPARRRRWGLLTLAFLALALVAIWEAQALHGHTLGTLGSLVLGVCGAAYCSVRGVREARARGLAGLLDGRRRRR